MNKIIIDLDLFMKMWHFLLDKQSESDCCIYCYQDHGHDEECIFNFIFEEEF